jgi:molybdate transport system substrate-binding protein
LVLFGVLAATSVAVGCGSDDEHAAAPVRVAAAADLTLAFEELGRAFERETGQTVTFSFGSTGLLARQLREGAPFDVFAAANASFVDDVVAAGACDGATKAPYARGRIVVWTRRGAVAPPRAFSDLADARFRRIAIANPEHAPYGRAARQALERAGIFDAVEPRLVLGENVRQAFQFAETGNVDAAIVARALVVNDSEGPSLLVDESLHQPIDQALVVCNRGDSRAGGEELARFVSSEPGRAVMRRYGFLLPSERLTHNP